MDILEEIDETINEKKGKWNYTPMREKSETDALIDELLKEFSSVERPNIRPVKSDENNYNVKSEVEERKEYESRSSQPEPKYEPKNISKPEPRHAPEPEQRSIPRTEPKHTSESESKSIPQPEPIQTSESESKSISQPEIRHIPDAEPEYKNNAEPEKISPSQGNEATQIFSRSDIEKSEKEDNLPDGCDEYNGSHNGDYSGYGNGGFGDDYYDENDFEEDFDKIQADELDAEEYAELEEFIDRQDSDLRIIKPKTKKSMSKTVMRVVCTAVVAAFTIIGVLSSALYCLEQFENSSSEAKKKEDAFKEEICKVVYPFVTTGLDSFDDPEKLSNQELVNLSLWEIIISLNGNMSVFKEDGGDKIIIPHTQVEYAVSKLLGMDKKIEPCDIKYAGVEIKYNKDKKGYIIPENTNVYTFYPVVTSVKEQDGVYTVGVECYNDLPKWSESKKASPVKKLAYTLKKTSDYYNILSARVIS